MEVIGSKAHEIVTLFDEKTKKYILVNALTDQEVAIDEDFLIDLGVKAKQRKKSFNIRPLSSTYDTVISSSLGKISIDGDSFITTTTDYSKEFVVDHDFILKGDWLKGEKKE